MTEQETVEFQVDVVQKHLKSLVKTIDESVKTGPEARELHDFVQDELLPVLALIAGDVRSLAEIVMEHDAAIADLDQSGADGTQILPEHAEELKSHLTECNSILQQLVKNAQDAKVDASLFEQRIAVGNALIEFVDSVTMTLEDEGEDEQE